VLKQYSLNTMGTVGNQFYIFVPLENGRNTLFTRQLVELDFCFVLVVVVQKVNLRLFFKIILALQAPTTPGPPSST
jgi:hypothetical protein